LIFLLNLILILMIVVPFILSSLLSWFFFCQFHPLLFNFINFHIIFSVYSFIMHLKPSPWVDLVMSRVMGWVEWSELPGSIKFFYYAESKNDIILIKKIMVKKTMVVAWFFIELKSKNNIILIKKIMKKKNQYNSSLFWK
jgi:hypothetical protein